jgi:hypothetical protein
LSGLGFAYCDFVQRSSRPHIASTAPLAITKMGERPLPITKIEERPLPPTTVSEESE